MSVRKNICFITARPEKSHGRRVLDGIFTQCEKYGYNVSVICSLTHLQNFAKTFNVGEQNIYNLIDYSNFDAVILDTIALTEDYTGNTIRKISDRIEKECKCLLSRLSCLTGIFTASETTTSLSCARCAGTSLRTTARRISAF